MGYIQFSLVFDKGGKGGQRTPLKIHIPLIMMKFKPYQLDCKLEVFLEFQLSLIIIKGAKGQNTPLKINTPEIGLDCNKPILMKCET